VGGGCSCPCGCLRGRAGRGGRRGGAPPPPTARAVSRLILEAAGEEAPPHYAVAVNLRRPDGFAYALAASVLVGAHTGIYVPVEEVGGETVLPAAARDAVRGTGLQGVVVGGGDVVPPEVRADLHHLLHDPG
jgi:hypothetical protein